LSGAAALLSLTLGLAVAIAPAAADKVGVAAAVNPDAFSSLAGSPQSQLSIGKSIFYNERINTTGSGLVQVLLVDGSTFTVGPGSDLVIDKFVYDPKKGVGQISASFSKGVMRFVGGKISKNEGGVSVDTPAGALAIRGGIVYADFKNAKTYSILFVFGDYAKLGNQPPVYEPGNGYFSLNGQTIIKPFTAADLKGIMVSLTNSNTSGSIGNSSGSTASPPKMLATQSLNQLIADANTEMVLAGAKETNPPTTTPGSPSPPPCTELCDGGQGLGYAGGVYKQFSTGQNDDDPVGVVTSRNSTQVAFAFNFPEGSNTPTSFSANFQLSAGPPWEQQGGIDVLFGNTTSPAYWWQRRSWIDQGGGLLAFNAPDGISIYGDNGPDTPHQVVGWPSASLVSSDFGWGFGGNLDLCNDCNVQWGAFTTFVRFIDGAASDSPNGHMLAYGPNAETSYPDINTVAILGWWIAGDIPPVGQLPITGEATYSGSTIATVANDLYSEGLWSTYVATGDVDMSWNFGTRKGLLEISKFDREHFGPEGLGFSGSMCAPGVTSCGTTPDGVRWATPNGNHFGGPLKGQLPNGFMSEGLTVAQRDLNGFALGSFVRGPTNYQVVNDAPVPISRSIPQGVIGNWAVGGDRYLASGVFGAPRN
jgi:hypothetical protein